MQILMSYMIASEEHVEKFQRQRFGFLPNVSEHKTAIQEM